MLRSKSAFTLVEILIALSILAMIVASTFTIFKSSASSWQKGETRTERYHNARVAMGRMSKEISQAVISGNATGKFSGQKDTVSFFSFVSTSEGIFELAGIEYRLDNEKRFLMRNEDILAEGISELDFSYYDGLIWNDTWEPDAEEEEIGLPEAVKIKIKVEDKKGKESETFEVITRLKTA